MDRDNRRLKLSNNTLNPKLRKTVAEVFRLKTSDISINDNTNTIEGWDSLAHIHLILSIEQAFNVKFPARLMAKLTSLKIIQKALQDKGLI